MGSKYEIWIWLPRRTLSFNGEPVSYDWYGIWDGNSFIKCLAAFFRLKRRFPESLVKLEFDNNRAI